MKGVSIHLKAFSVSLQADSGLVQTGRSCSAADRKPQNELLLSDPQHFDPGHISLLHLSPPQERQCK